MTSCLLYATWNRGDLLSRSLARLAELTVPDEVLVVDDGGDDGTEGVCARARDELGLPIRYLYTHHPGEQMCSHARNVGVCATDADVVITSEPEMWFETDVIAQLLARHEDDQQWGRRQFVNVGRVLHEQPPGRGPCHCCGREKHETVNWQATWVCLYRREWLLEVGGWDEGFPLPWGWDDVDLGSRLRIGGVGQYNDLDAVATHMWHESRICGQAPNEAYFKAKGFHGDERRDHPHLVANRDDPAWGRPIPRP